MTGDSGRSTPTRHRPARGGRLAARSGGHAVPTVLVVDAEFRRRRGLETWLSDVAGRVLGAPSAELALYVVATSAVDLVLSVEDLPGMGGHELLVELRGRGGPPLVALVPAGRTATVAAWLDAGAAGCVAPTEDPRAVAARLRAILRRC